MGNKVEVKAKYTAPIIGYFEIDNGNSVYRLMEGMADSMTQDKLAEFYEIEKKKGNPIPMNSIQHIELFDDAVRSGNADLLNFLYKGLQKSPNTLTRIISGTPFGQGEIIHNYETSDSFSMKGDIIDKNIFEDKQIENTKFLELLLGKKDIPELYKILDPIFMPRSISYYVDPKFQKKGEMGVSFFAGKDIRNFILCFNTDWNLFDGVQPSFLVQKIN